MRSACRAIAPWSFRHWCFRTCIARRRLARARLHRTRLHRTGLPIRWRLCGWLSTALYLAVASGISLPLPAPAAEGVQKDKSQPYPCMNSPCGCRSAEQCWRHCCCHTLAQRLEWARENHVQPPDYVLAEAAAEGIAWKPDSGSSCCSDQDCCAQQGRTCCCYTSGIRPAKSIEPVSRAVPANRRRRHPRPESC